MNESTENTGLLLGVAGTIIAILSVIAYMFSVVNADMDKAIAGMCHKPIADVRCGNEGCKGDNTVVHGYVSAEP